MKQEMMREIGWKIEKADQLLVEAHVFMMDHAGKGIPKSYEKRMDTITEKLFHLMLDMGLTPQE